MGAPKIDARRRAREAKARLDAERVERDKQIEDATTAFYVADDKIEELQAQVDAATTDRNTHVRALLDLGESVERVAGLTGLDARDVRQIKRAAVDTSDASVPVPVASSEAGQVDAPAHVA